MLTSKFIELQDKGKKFVVIFVSCDRSEKEFKEYLAFMPWQAVKFDDSSQLAKARSLLPTRGIPSLGLFEKSGSGFRCYSLEGRSVSLCAFRLFFILCVCVCVCVRLSPTANAPLTAGQRSCGENFRGNPSFSHKQMHTQTYARLECFLRLLGRFARAIIRYFYREPETHLNASNMRPK